MPSMTNVPASMAAAYWAALPATACLWARTALGISVQTASLATPSKAISPTSRRPRGGSARSALVRSSKASITPSVGSTLEVVNISSPLPQTAPGRRTVGTGVGTSDWARAGTGGDSCRTHAAHCHPDWPGTAVSWPGPFRSWRGEQPSDRGRIVRATHQQREADQQPSEATGPRPGHGIPAGPPPSGTLRMLLLGLIGEALVSSQVPMKATTWAVRASVRSGTSTTAIFPSRSRSRRAGSRAAPGRRARPAVVRATMAGSFRCWAAMRSPCPWLVS